MLAVLLLLLAAASFVPSVLAVRESAHAVPSLALQVAVFVAGLLLLRVPEHRSDAWWLVAATLFMGVSFFGWLPVLETGYWNQVAWWVNWAPAACLVGPVLRLPDQPASPRTVRRLSVATWIVTVGLLVVAGLFWDPAMNGYSGPSRWLTLVASEPAYWAVVTVICVAFVPIAVGVTVAQVGRHRRAAGPGRLALRLLAWSTIAMTWGLEARFVLNVIVRAPWEVRTVVDSAHLVFSSAAVLVVLGVAIAANLRRAGFLDALLATGGDAAAIEGVLGSYVADPTLRLRFHTDEGWTDAAGVLVAEASPPAGRVFHPIVVEPDGPAVVADLDASVDPTGRAVGSLLDAAGVVLARARLSVQQAAQAVELRASRARIVEAGVQQRRQLERDLHDGAQQHLLAAQAALARAGLGGEPEAVADAIAFAQSRLTTTMAELRRLARGQHPALLSQAGLAAALGSLVQLSDRVHVDAAGLDGRRFAPVVEATAWFVASEGVVNALKHTDDGAVTVTADVDGVLRIRIADAGGGGADFAPGGGLAGLRDRVRGAGGTLLLDSPAGVGTTLTATLPTTTPRRTGECSIDSRAV